MAQSVSPDGRLIDTSYEGQQAPVAGLGTAVINLDDLANKPGEKTMIVEQQDGGVVVQLLPDGIQKKASTNFNDNLAETLSEDELSSLAEEILMGIEADEQSRKVWEDNLNDAMTQLGLQKDVVSSLDLDSMSKCRHPILLSAVINFQSQALAEMLPSEGPVKVSIDKDATTEEELFAETLEKAFNHYLTVVATEYVPDTDRGLFRIGFIGGIVKKVYRCPIRKRPVSETVYLEDLIVSNDITDLENATRVTHRIPMTRNGVKRMQVAGAWRDIPLVVPSGDLSSTQKRVGEIEGLDRSNNNYEQDRLHTIYETCVDLNIDGDSKADGTLPCPYEVAIDKESRQILAIYRNWKEDDEDYAKKQLYVLWPYIPGLGWYPIGLAQILRNDTSTLTAIQREAVDAGMFANFPSFLYADALGRQETNRFRMAPGAGVGIKVPAGMNIAQSVMPVPYKDITPGLMQLFQAIQANAEKLGSMAEIPVGEGMANVPVGTVIAMIEQGTKTMQAVHKRLHIAQARELELLKDLFVEDPTALTRFNRDPNQIQFTSEELLNTNFSPRSDPNTPSHIHRIMKAQALYMMASQSPPGLFDNRACALYVMKTIGIADGESLLAPGPPPGAPPPAPPGKPGETPTDIAVKQADIQIKQQEQQRKAASTEVDAQQQRAELAAKTQDNAEQNQLAAAKLALEQQRLHIEAGQKAADSANNVFQANADRQADAAQTQNVDNGEG